jgi:hypothetical protein
MPPATLGVLSPPPPDFSSGSAGTSTYTTPLVTTTKRGPLCACPVAILHGTIRLFALLRRLSAHELQQLPASWWLPAHAMWRLSAHACRSRLSTAGAAVTVCYPGHHQHHLVDHYSIDKQKLPVLEGTGRSLLRSKLFMGYVDGSLVCPLLHTRFLIMAGLRCRNPTQPTSTGFSRTKLSSPPSCRRCPRASSHGHVR